MTRVKLGELYKIMEKVRPIWNRRKGRKILFRKEAKAYSENRNHDYEIWKNHWNFKDES